MEKYHKTDICPIEKENERDKNYKADNPQIDIEKTIHNYNFVIQYKSYTEFINDRIKSLNLNSKPRKDAVIMNSFVLGSDNKFFSSLHPWETRDFFTDCYEFFAKRYGEENIISAVVHQDETTPHMHLNLVSITTDGRLCSKELFNKQRLRDLQTDFYECVGKKYYLERGKEGSQTIHLSTAEFKAKKIIEKAQEEADKINIETDKQKEIIEEAKNTKLSSHKGKLQELITALLSENKSLTKRLDTSMKETLEFAQENRKLQGQVETLSKMAKVGLEVSKSYPSIYREITSPQKPIKRNDYFNGNSK